jgi:hypothetical protein
LLPVFIACPSSFHNPFASSNDHKGIVAGAFDKIAAGIGIVSVAFWPVAICNNSPEAPVNSTAAMPKVVRVFNEPSVAIPRRSPGISWFKSEAVGFIQCADTLTLPVYATSVAAFTTPFAGNAITSPFVRVTLPPVAALTVPDIVLGISLILKKADLPDSAI